MKTAKVCSAQIHLLVPALVEVETDISRGLNAFSVVGLPDKAVEEAKDRVASAIKNCGYDSPRSKNHKTIISLAPASIKKEGPHFDLPIALSYLLASGSIKFDPSGKIFAGELSLDGIVRPIKEVLAFVIGAKKLGINEIYIPEQNKKDVLMIPEVKIFPVSHLNEIILHLDKKKVGAKNIEPMVSIDLITESIVPEVDMSDVSGQEGAKRALEIAAAGGHHIMLYGPPGTGKTMLAKAFANIMPNLSFEDSMEVSLIHSSFGNSKIISQPPFRSPHHSSSSISLIGGGLNPRPGEITLAHKGIMFMDEFPEFGSKAIEVLRQPLEERKVNVSRSRHAVSFPASFILIASMNPCPCGFRGSTSKVCRCGETQIERYRRKISGPIMDRIDMWTEVCQTDPNKLGLYSLGDTTKIIKERVKEARKSQTKRFKNIGISLNSEIKSNQINKFCQLDGKCRQLLNSSSEKLNLSPRSYYKILKLARTIADLDNKENIEEKHLLEAFQYRPKF